MSGADTFLPQALSFSRRDEYVFSAPGGVLTSRHIELNGELLQAAADGTLPPLQPSAQPADSMLTLQPATYALLRFVA
jgi:hypothetical protein